MQFSVDVTHAGELISNITYYADGIDTYDMNLREELNSITTPQPVIYILNQAQQKAWVYEQGKWTDISAFYALFWTDIHGQFEEWEGMLARAESWNSSEDYLVIAPNGDSVRFYNIAVNPSLPDSLFQPKLN